MEKQIFATNHLIDQLKKECTENKNLKKRKDFHSLLLLITLILSTITVSHYI